MIKKPISLRTVSYAAPVCDFLYATTGHVLCESNIPDAYHEGGADTYEDDDIVDNGGY